MFTHPIIDCHHHVFDPDRFPWAPDSTYRPEGHELGTPDNYMAVMEACNIRHSLIVAPTSGYNTDNRCLLDTLLRGEGRFKGIALVPDDISLDELAKLKSQGIVGIALNVAMSEPYRYQHLDGLIGKLNELDLFTQLQVVDDQLTDLIPLLQRTRPRLIVDHSGRPNIRAGLDQPAFRALLALADQPQTFVKLSGLAKFSVQSWPFRDGWPYLYALLDAFTAERCLWGSDWPFLRATERMDISTQLLLMKMLIDDDHTLKQVLWDTPCRVFGFPVTTDD